MRVELWPRGFSAETATPKRNGCFLVLVAGTYIKFSCGLKFKEVWNPNEVSYSAAGRGFGLGNSRFQVHPA